MLTLNKLLVYFITKNKFNLLPCSTGNGVLLLIVFLERWITQKVYLTFTFERKLTVCNLHVMWPSGQLKVENVSYQPDDSISPSQSSIKRNKMALWHVTVALKCNGHIIWTLRMVGHCKTICSGWRPLMNHSFATFHVGYAMYAKSMFGHILKKLYAMVESAWGAFNLIKLNIVLL